MTRPMQRFLFTAALIGALAAPAASHAQPGWFDLRVPGSAERLARAAGLAAGTPAEGADVVHGLLHELQDGGADAPGAGGGRDYLNALELLRTRWRAVEALAGDVRLSAVRDRRSREALEAFLEVLGLSLTVDGEASTYRVVRGRGRRFRRSAYGRWLDTVFAGEGWRAEDVQGRLNAGDAVDWDLEHFTVPLPLSPAAWSSLVYGSNEGTGASGFVADRAADLLARIVSDPELARFYSGLAALDTATLAYVAERSRLLNSLRRARAFAEYAGSLRVRDGQVVVPGGDLARAAWEDLVGAPISEPDAFFNLLLRPSSEAIAHFFDSMVRLPRAHQRFALGAWLDEPSRRSSFVVLWRTFERLRSGQHGILRPGPLAILRAVLVDESGAPRAPASRDFWSAVFGNRPIGRLSDDLSSFRGLERSVDAGFLLAAVLDSTAAVEVGRDRLRAFCFAQRVFHEAGAGETSAVAVAARAFGRYPMLMLSLERMGIRDPAVYVSLAQSADRFAAIEGAAELHNTLSQFQGSLALIERARLAGALPVTAVSDVLAALARVPLAEGGTFNGGIVAWLAADLLPALNVPPQPQPESNAVERQVLAVLAGARRNGGEQAAAALEWEGLEYRFDRGAMQRERFGRTRAGLRGPGLDALLAVWMQAARLASGVGTVDEIAPIVDALLGAAASLETSQATRGNATARGVTYAQALRAVAGTLREVTDARRLNRIPGVVRRLARVVDAVAGEVLRTLTYTVHLAAADRVFDADVALRHDFGTGLAGTEARYRTAWTAAVDLAVPDGWRLRGALLSLDVALAHTYLPRVSGVVPSGAPQRLHDADVTQLTRAVTLFSPHAVSDAQLGRIAETIRRGRQRVDRLAGNALDLLDAARDLGLGPARRTRLERAGTEGLDGLHAFFSRSDLFWLGAREGDVSALPGWGAPTTALDGCLCLRIPPAGDIDLQSGVSGRLAYRFTDLQFALAEAVDRLSLPAAIIRDLLPIATRELLDGAPVMHAGDIDALVQYVSDLSDARIADYVASLVQDGPLFMPESGG